MTQTRLDPKSARHGLTDHPYYRYRGCAPDPDDPAVAAGDWRVPVTSWDAPDVDGGEPQPARIARERAAKAVCGGCPVRVVCLVYGSSVTREGRLAEPFAILGGMTGLERHRALIKDRQERREREQELARVVPDRHLRTPQKLAVLRALAAHIDPVAVAEAARMDVRTANWQRSILVGKLGLAHTASRRELLDAAVRRGLLDDVRVVADDGRVPAVPPPSRGPAGAVAVQLSLDDLMAQVPAVPAAVSGGTVTRLTPRARVLGAAA